MTQFLETLFAGISTGSLYALIALGYTMVYGTLQFINFAHGDVFMVGGWLSFMVAQWMGWAVLETAPPIFAAPFVLISAMVLCALLGFTIERLAYRPLRSAPRLNILITAIGVSLLIQNVGQLPQVFGTQPQRVPALLPDNVLFEVEGVRVHLVDAVGLATTLALMAGLVWLVYRTKIGLAMRAVSANPRVASLMGVPVDRVIATTFVIGSALAAAAGFLFTAKYPVINQPSHQTWILLGLKAFVAAVVGGIGNIHGAVIGGLLIGLIEMFGAAYLSTQLRDVYVFAILIGVLLVLPTGILGKSSVEKV